MAMQTPYASQSIAQASYDFQEIASGEGIVNFYAAQSVMSGSSIINFLTSDEGTYSGYVVNNNATVATGLIETKNYEVIFNLPTTINGNVRMSFTQGANNGSAQVYLNLALYKVSGAVVTQIGSSVESVKTVYSTSVTSDTRNLVIATGGRIHFGINDKLRLTVQLKGKNAGGSSCIGYGIDPKDRDDEGEGIVKTQVVKDINTTQFKIAVPFVVDL